MTTVTFQNGRNLIQFISQTSSVIPNFFLRLNYSFSLSNKYVDFKKIM